MAQKSLLNLLFFASIDAYRQTARGSSLLGGEIVTLLDALLQLGKGHVYAVFLKVSHRSQAYTQSEKSNLHMKL